MTEVLSIRNEEIPVRSNVEKPSREILSELLGRVVASTYVLAHKTHAFHWNVSGPLFFAVHTMTDEQYKDLTEATDKLAERIRAIGFAAPVGLGNYVRESMLPDITDFPDTGTMLHVLAQDHQTLANQIRDVVAEAERCDDYYTADLLTSRIGVHEKAAWQLNALIVQ